MTKLILKNEDGRFLLKVQNHTKSDVCTAISILLYTLAENIIKAERNGRIEDFNYRLQSGDAYLNIKPKPNFKEDIETMIDIVKTGFELLEAQYPECISLSVNGGV